MSSASSPCRIEWRPSRWAVGGAASIGALAALAVAISGLPLWWRAVLALASLACGAVGAWHEARKPRWTLYWPGTDARAQRLVGDRVEAVVIRSVHLRGPLAGVTLNEASGRVVHALWWPDTLGAVARRELALRARFSDVPPPA